MKIAITGGIGSGKSYVCSILKSKGIEVYDCDSAAKQIMVKSKHVVSELKNLIGDKAYVDGKINKPCISSFILASKDNAEKVNNIVHPAVARDFEDSGLNFMECAILFSCGFDKLVDRVVCVTAPLEVRIQRIIKRDSISEEKAKEWIDCQMSQNQIVSLSDFVIENKGDNTVDEQVDRLLYWLKNEDKKNI